MFSFVLEGTWGFMLGDEIVHAGPGDLVYKPRNVWHTFWNASDQPARLLEVISPAGFEHFFEELARVLESDPDDIVSGATFAEDGDVTFGEDVIGFGQECAPAVAGALGAAVFSRRRPR